MEQPFVFLKVKNTCNLNCLLHIKRRQVKADKDILKGLTTRENYDYLGTKTIDEGLSHSRQTFSDQLEQQRQHKYYQK